MSGSPLFDLSGRTAIVTGVGSERGIGAAVAKVLSGMGASLVVSASSARVHDRAAELTEGTAAVVGDLTRVETSELIVQKAMSEFGRLDIVVHCAGLTSVSAPADEAGHADELSLDAWRAGLSRNLDAAFLIAKAALPMLTSSPCGRLVMVASLTGPVMAMRGEIAYGAAKAGVVGLVRSLAVDVASSGVTVNAVAPGWIATDSQTADEHLQGLRTPVGRSGTADEVAGLIGYLCTSSAAYLTGQCLVVDGGNSIAEQRA